MQIDREAILQAKEKLGDRNAQIIVEELGITDFDEKNMKCCCPFHQEDHASFIYNKKAFNFRCFGSCGRSYDILDVFMYKGATYAEACKKLFELAEMPYSFGELGVKPNDIIDIPMRFPVLINPKCTHILSNARSVVRRWMLSMCGRTPRGTWYSTTTTRTMY